jgi:hypothetical protein
MSMKSLVKNELDRLQQLVDTYRGFHNRHHGGSSDRSGEVTAIEEQLEETNQFLGSVVSNQVDLLRTRTEVWDKLIRRDQEQFNYILSMLDKLKRSAAHLHQYQWLLFQSEAQKVHSTNRVDLRLLKKLWLRCEASMLECYRNSHNALILPVSV